MAQFVDTSSVVIFDGVIGYAKTANSMQRIVLAFCTWEWHHIAHRLGCSN